MKELKYVDKIRSGESLLSMPQSLSQILSMMNSDDFSMDDLGDVILKDPGLTSKVLKMANSAFYRQRTEISTVNQAVVMLGVMQVKCLALSASVFHKEDLEAKNGVNFKDLFSHFISVAIGSRMLARAVAYKGAEEAFIAGLLHDIGLVFFIHHFPEDYRQVVDKVNIYPDLIEAEKDILGIDHAAVGQLMAEKWNFPKSLCDAIGQHHKTVDRVDEIEIRHLVQLSELINKPVIDDRPRHLERRLGLISQLSRKMKIERKAIDEISFSLLTETVTTAEYLGIDIGDTSEVVTRANKELFNSYITIEKLFRERRDLSHRILKEERRAAMMETKNVAIATLSHYINNAAMAISGRGQLIKMLVGKGVIMDNDQRLAPIADIIEKSVNKIMAVLEELRDLTNLDDIEKYSESEAINIDDRIRERLQKMEHGGTECVVQRPEIDR